MSETTFAKAFLAMLDKKPVKLSSDHVSDPKKYPSQSPYVLPRPTHPFPRRERPGTASAPQTFSITLKPMRAPSTPVTLSSQSADTTILELKTQYAQQSGQDATKVKLLLNKRPCADLKTLKDLLPQPAPTEVEFSVMILGGGAASPAAVASPAPASPAVELSDPTSTAKTANPDPAPLSEQAEAKSEIAHTGESTANALQSDEFWTDLKGFLVQRLRDEAEGERLAKVFRKAAT